MVLRPGARPSLGACDRHSRAAGMLARQSLLALCRDMDLHVATLFPGQLGGLGHDRGFLYRDRDFFALSRNRNSVSRQGLGLAGFRSRQGSPYVATEFSQGWDIPVTIEDFMS